MIPILGERHWECPNCTIKAITRKATAPMPMHTCRGLKGLNAPMVPEGTKCKVEAMEREDYVKKDDVHYDGEGKAIMSIVTTRDDGQDCAVLVPCATGTLER